MVLVLLAAAATPSEAGKGRSKTGVIKLTRETRLRFPNPGRYAGLIMGPYIDKIKAARNEVGKKAGGRNRKRAYKKALRWCERHTHNTPVKVLHLSKPPFLIGRDRVESESRFRRPFEVLGPEPPHMDKVKAVQKGDRRLWGNNFIWRFICAETSVVEPYRW